ncbi:MAG: hypothetical protein ABSH20_30230, partial [Tepidisphaeraceae bacterium]
MRTKIGYVAVLTAAALWAPIGADPVRAADSEEKFIAVLGSSSAAGQKDQACFGLMRIGTSKAVPVLAPLLLDEELSM